MENIIEKITSYNLFNYLLPGVLFSVISEKFLSIKVSQENIIVYAFICYFIGLTVSRFGSLVLEPFLKKIGFLKFSEYSDFVKASKKDLKIEIFSQENNSYRTYCSLFFLLLTIKIMEIFIPINGICGFYILVVLLLIIYLCSYRKQTNFIVKRVNFYKKNK